MGAGAAWAGKGRGLVVKLQLCSRSARDVCIRICWELEPRAWERPRMVEGETLSRWKVAWGERERLLLILWKRYLRPTYKIIKTRAVNFDYEY